MTLSYTIAGGRAVTGEITALGAKNYATKAMVCAALGNAPTILGNVPPIGDVEITVNLIQSTGCTVEWLDDTTLKIDPTTMAEPRVTLPDSRSNRIPILLMPALLHKFGVAKIPRLDGCAIGKRPVDFHESAMRQFGAEVEVKKDQLVARLPKEEKEGAKEGFSGLKGCHISLPYPSVGATETCLFLAAMAEGTSVIENAAVEPEIMELITQLRGMGAIIFQDTDRKLTIEGVQSLGGTHMHILGDRIEVASWASLACATDGNITVHGIRPNTMGSFLSTYRQVGGGFELLSEQSIRFFRAETLKPITLETGVFPGFSTDWQQPFVVLLTQAEGMSVVHETVYESRFGYTKALNALGAQIQLSDKCLGEPCRYKDKGHPHSALISGATKLTATDDPMEVPDLRAGLAYVIAAALAEGVTTLTGIEKIERGYGNLIERTRGLNLEIERSEA